MKQKTISFSCPIDKIVCQGKVVSIDGKKITAQTCPVCQGFWIDADGKKTLDTKHFFTKQTIASDNSPARNLLKNPLCPRCQFPLHEDNSQGTNKNFACCFNCSLYWLSGKFISQSVDNSNTNSLLTIETLRGAVQIKTFAYFFALALSTALYLWQKHTAHVLADAPYLEANNPSNHFLAGAVWLVILFSLIILPLSIFLQVAIQGASPAHVIKKPTTTIIPIITVILALVNVIIIIPVF